MPMLRDCINEAIQTMHHVALAVTKVFLAHLKQTWYGLDNAPLELLYDAVSSRLQSKITNDKLSYRYLSRFNPCPRAHF